MASIRGKAFSAVVRKFANLTPAIESGDKELLIKNLRGMEPLLRHYIAPIGYQLKKYDVDGLPIELFSKKKDGNENLIFVCHGGAYVSRMIFYYRWMNKKYSKACGGGSVLHFDYVCSPEVKYPEHLNQAMKAWDWALEQGFKEENIITIGDSAGGHMNISLLMKLHDMGKKMPRAAVFLSPWLDMTGSGKSYIENYNNDPLFGKKNYKPTQADVDRLLQCGMFDWFDKKEDRKDPYISPVYAEFDNSYPPSLITAGGNEMLLSDSETLFQKLRDAGVEVTLDITEGMFHVFNLYQIMPESKRAIKLVNDFIKEQFSK